MTKQTQKRAPRPQPDLEGGVGNDDFPAEDVALVRAAGGRGVSLLPVSVAKVTGEAAEVLAELQQQSLAIRLAHEAVGSLVGEARSHGVSWEAIGWCLGVSGSAVHKRFAADQ